MRRTKAAVNRESATNETIFQNPSALHDTRVISLKIYIKQLVSALVYGEIVVVRSTLCRSVFEEVSMDGNMQHPQTEGYVPSKENARARKYMTISQASRSR